MKNAGKGKLSKTLKHILNIKIYKEACAKSAEDPSNRVCAVKCAVYGVKAVITLNVVKAGRKEALSALEFTSGVKERLSILNSQEIMNIFPIEKYYPEEPADPEVKSYDSVRKAIAEFDDGTPVGDRIDNFLGAYLNQSLRRFSIKRMEIIDSLRKMNGQPTVAEEWAKDNGMDLAEFTKKYGYLAADSESKQK